MDPQTARAAAARPVDGSLYAMASQIRTSTPSHWHFDTSGALDGAFGDAGVARVNEIMPCMRRISTFWEHAS